jgi:hypothetical protein
LNRPIGDDEHFLDAGGQSLLALKIVSHVAETFNLTIGVRDLLAAPTPRRFCGLIEARYLEEYVSEGVVVLPDGRALACQDPLKTVAEYLASTAEAS